MARATTKEDLLCSAKENFESLFNLINSLSDVEQKGNFNFDETTGKEAHWKRDKNIRDVLIHLYEWHQLLINWVESNMNGDPKSFLPSQYNWKNYGEMNVEFWKKHQETKYENAVEMVKKSHEEVLEIIEKFTTEELFAKKQFNWTGSTTLGSYCVSATGSHYDWAIKKIKKYKKELSEVK